MRKFTTGLPGDAERPRTASTRGFGEHLGNDDQGADRKRQRRVPQPCTRKRVAKRAVERVTK